VKNWWLAVWDENGVSITECQDAISMYTWMQYAAVHYINIGFALWAKLELCCLKSM
jgi:hypothetical protein